MISVGRAPRALPRAADGETRLPLGAEKEIEITPQGAAQGALQPRR
jgi:hypothetical protein